MPYEILFAKPSLAGIVASGGADIEERAGESAAGVVILPKFIELHPVVFHGIQDWGWGAWATRGGYGLSVDITCRNDATGEYSARITSVKRRFLIFQSVKDIDELEALRSAVEVALSDWGCTNMKTVKIPEKEG